ncbi:hypothetical protein [Caldithrix abyssi]
MKKILWISFLALFLWLAGCQEKKSDIAQKEGIYEITQHNSCVACHTNKALLEEVADPLEEGEGEEAGEG